MRERLSRLGRPIALAVLVPALAAAAALQTPIVPENRLSILHVLNLPLITDFDLSPDGRRLVFAVRRLGREHLWWYERPGDDAAPTPARRLFAVEGRRDRDPALDPRGERVAFVSDREEGWHLFVAPVAADASPRQLSRHHGEDATPRWSPDGRWICYRSRRVAGETGWDLWLVPADGGEPRRLTRLPLDEEDPQWSPDGTRIAFVYGGGRYADRRLGVVAVGEGGAADEPRPLLPEDWPGDAHEPRWSPDGRRLAFVSDHEGRDAIYAVDAAGGPVRRLVGSEHEETEPAWRPDGKALAHVSNRDGTLYLMETELETGRARRLSLGGGVYAKPRWTADGEAVHAFYEGPTYPRDVWRFGVAGGRERLTESLFADLDVRQMIRPELVRYESPDGTPITGFLYLPADASSEAPAPLVVRAHDGPTDQWRNGWHPVTQLLAQEGFAVLVPNVRGSTGFGRAFEKSNDRDWGRGDLEDLVAGARHAMARPEVRDDRVAVWGVRYGAFLAIAAIVRYPDFFTCAVEAVGAPDLEKLYRETNEEGRAWLEAELGPLRGNLALYRELSPARADLRVVRTPLLSFHSHRDPRWPYEAKKPFIDALRRPRYPLTEYVYKNDLGRSTYEPYLMPGPARFYLEKVLEFFEVYL